MTTIINTPPSTTDDSSIGVILGMIFGAIVVVAIIFFGIRHYTPAQSAAVTPNSGTTVNLVTPTVQTTGTGTTTTTY